LIKKHKKRILVIIDSLGYGGAERLLVSLLPKIDSDDLRVDVVTLLADISLMPELEKEKINVIPLNATSRWSFFKILKDLRKTVKDNNYNIVWGHLYFGNFYSAILGYLFPKLRVIWTLHSPGYSNNPQKKFKHKVKVCIEKFMGHNRVNHIVAVSKAVSDDYMYTTKWKSISVIYNGIDFSKFPTVISKKTLLNTRAKYGIKKSDILIVTPGRYAPEKGHKFMIEALKILNTKYKTQVQWVCTGSGNFKGYIDKLAKSSILNDNIHLLNSLPHQDLLSLVQSSDLVVIPSIREPFGIVAVESMGLGVPTIVSYVDGLREVSFGDIESPNNIKPCNSGDIAKKIFVILNDKKIRKKLVVFGKNRAIDLFDIQKSADKWIDLLNKA
jgi:glycosyltransferase involved in cell wall biosynthesis